ncbi:MAG: ankyrin repeat domain-containing protein [Wolbachia endosymbiont of Fragariocoptes setiger]|nr:ankyrin repeat domain-containing protein [Wolbachia endosymbiont of Fragariocoptes setiger]
MSKKQECDDLHEAIRNRNIKEIQKLIEKDAKIICEQDTRMNGEGSLHVAAEVGNLEIMKILVQASEKNGFNLINQGNLHNKTPIFYAVKEDFQLEVLDFLLRW